MKFSQFLLASVALVPFPLAARANPPQGGTSMNRASAALPITNINYQQFMLGNGLRLVVHEDHNAPVVAISVYYHVGSKDETLGKTGFAHLFEHLMFSGSEHAKNSWFSYTNPLGATGQNGTTSFDRTNFYETVPVASLDRVLWLESDRMGHLLGAIDQRKLDEQRGVVENEKRQRANTPFGTIPETISSATYPVNHPYSWQPIGSIPDLDAATLDDVKAWFSKWYGPQNAVLVISGDVSAADVKKKVELYFGDIPGGKPLKRTDHWVAKLAGERSGTLEVAAPDGHFLKVWNVPGYGTYDAEMLQIACWVLGGNSNSRLYQRLVYNDKVATGASVSATQYELGGQVVIDINAKPGANLDNIERAVSEEVTRFLHDGPTLDELQRYKAMTYGEMIQTADSAAGSGALLAENTLYAGSPGFYRTALKWDYDATSTEVRNVASQWLSDGSYILRATPLPTFVVTPGADRTKMPDLGPAPTIALIPPERFTLSNGLKVELVERHSAPTFVGSLMFSAGTTSDRGSTDTMTGKLATLLTMEGTRTRSFNNISAGLQSIGSLMVWGAGRETTTLSFGGQSGKLAETLDIFGDVLANPSFPQEAFSRRRAELFAQLAQTKSVAGGKLYLAFGPIFYGKSHPYGEVPTEKGIASITLSSAREWYHRWIRPDNATLLVVGDVTEAQLRPILERRLSGWKAPASPLPVPAAVAPLAIPKAPRIFLIDQPGAETSVISAADLTVKASDPRLEAVTTVNGIMGGSFLGRLNMDLREDKHWSYGVKSGLELGKLSTEFSATTSVQTDKTADAVKELDHDFREIFTTRKPTELEIRTAKNNIVLTLPGKMQGASGIGGMYSQLIEYGLPDDYWNHYIDHVESLTPTEIEAALALMERPDELTWFIIGDLSKIEAPVRALKLGEVKVVDVDGNVLR